MSRALPLIALVLAGCAPRYYVQATATEPHSVVTVRVLHHTVSGPHLHHDTTLNGFAIADDRDAVVQGTPLTRVVRVRLEPADWRFASVFSHQVTESRMETVYESQSYPCGTYTSGYGNSRYAGTRYCTRQVPRQRLRTYTRTVVDGSCDRQLVLMPQLGQRYLIQFDYYGPGQCSARCFRQYPQPDGSFQLTACEGG